MTIDDETFDCGQDAVCAKPPGCQRHWQERNAELVRERDTLRAENTKLGDLLYRAIKYAREDRMRTPGTTRLARCLAKAERALTPAQLAAPVTEGNVCHAVLNEVCADRLDPPKRAEAARRRKGGDK